MADTTINLQEEITATGVLVSQANETVGRPNIIRAAAAGLDFKNINGQPILGEGNIDTGNDVGFSVVDGKVCLTFEEA